MSLAFKLKVIAAMYLALATSSASAAPEPFTALGRVRHAALPELSGLAPSRRHPGRWWAINDSGNAASLVALDARLRVVQEVAVAGATNHDWEDLASFERDGQSWLLIADVGDNLWLRSEVQLILVPEPAPGVKQLSPARTLRLRYADGPRDCEAVAVDPLRGRVLLADKGRRPVGLYEVALDSEDAVQVARRVAEFPELVPTPAPRVQALGAQHGRGTPTAMDLSADGRRLVVLTYLSATLFERAVDQAWPAALARPRLSLRLPRDGGFEAMSFDAEGVSALLANERVPSRFYRWSLPR